MKCFVVADVHSFYDEMLDSLNKKGFDKDNPQHVFISCGDLLDRGPKPIECLKFVLSLPRKILIRGNHEDLMIDAIHRRYFGSHDVHNGTFDTAQTLTNIKYDYDTDNQSIILEDMLHNELWNDYYNQTIDYAETNKYIFTHGWIPTFSEDWHNGDWYSARWSNGMYQNSIGLNPTGKTIVCGHYHTSWGHSKLHNKGSEWDDNVKTYENLFGATNIEHAHFETFKDKGIICLDGCTAISNIVNCEVLNIGKEQLKPWLNLP